MNDHGYVPFVVVIVEPSIMSGNEWSWICSVSLPDIMLGSTMTTTNGTYPWSFITTHNTWFTYLVMNDHGYVPFAVVMFEPSIMSGNEWSWICSVCRSHSWTKYYDDHSLQHRILGSTMTTTNETYPWSFITRHNTWFNYDYDKRNISMIIHYQWICSVCRSHVWTKYYVW
jgi:hypothetical protein